MLNICARGNHTSIFSDDNGNASKTSPLNMILACMCAKSLLSDLVEHEAKSCPTLCNPGDCGPPGSSVHGVLQARTLE